jgi:hypothetical protein
MQRGHHHLGFASICALIAPREHTFFFCGNKCPGGSPTAGYLALSLAWGERETALSGRIKTLPANDDHDEAEAENPE